MAADTAKRAPLCAPRHPSSHFKDCFVVQLSTWGNEGGAAFVRPEVFTHALGWLLFVPPTFPQIAITLFLSTSVLPTFSFEPAGRVIFFGTNDSSLREGWALLVAWMSRS